MAKSRVDITLCQHGKFPATLLLKFFVLYYKRNIKHFSVLIYSYINTRENWKNSKLCENTPPCGRRVSTQFLVFPIFTRVDITVYQHGKCFIFLKHKFRIEFFSISFKCYDIDKLPLELPVRNCVANLNADPLHKNGVLHRFITHFDGMLQIISLAAQKYCPKTWH